MWRIFVAAFVLIICDEKKVCCGLIPEKKSLLLSPRRRDVLWGGLPLIFFGTSQVSQAKCKDIDSCREQGEVRFENLEKKAGPMISLDSGVRYREMEKGINGPQLKLGDSADIRFQVLKGNGDFLYGVPNREPGANDLSQILRLTLGQKDVPVGVEEALYGASKGTRRRVELPPSLGFASSNWNPTPQTFSGIQRMKRFRNLFDTNPQYQPVLLFEFEVVRVRPSSSSSSSSSS